MGDAAGHGVACWLSPEHPIVTAADRDAAGWRTVGAAWGAAAFTRFQAFVADIGDVFGSFVAEPHWYLAWLCVDPGQQGQGMYRWHVMDPIRFAQDLRVTIQALGWRSSLEGQRRYLPLQDDIASTAF